MIGENFLTSLLEEGEVGGGSGEGGGRGSEKFFSIMQEGASEIFDPKIEIYNINYRENKNKINKDTNNVDKTKEII